MDKRRKTIIKFNKATLTDSNKMLSEMKKELQESRMNITDRNKNKERTIRRTIARLKTAMNNK